MARIAYAQLCEKAFLSQNGNLNIIGLFENLASQTFPLVLPQLVLVSYLEAEAGNFVQTLTLVKKDSQEAVIKPIQMNITVKEHPEKNTQNLRLISEINQLSFKEPGEYELILSLNNFEEQRLSLNIKHFKKPIPEGK